MRCSRVRVRLEVNGERDNAAPPVATAIPSLSSTTIIPGRTTLTTPRSTPALSRTLSLSFPDGHERIRTPRKHFISRCASPAPSTPKSHTLILQKDATLRTDAVQKLENASRENFVSITSNLLSPIQHLILFPLCKCSLPTC